MIINGKDIGFELTIESIDNISKMCPDGEYAKLTELYKGKTTAENYRTDFKIAKVLNEAHENHKYFIASRNGSNDYKKILLTDDDLEFMDLSELNTMENEIMQAMKTGKSTSVESQPIKSSGKKASTVNK
jgi:hypothetical protein